MKAIFSKPLSILLSIFIVTLSLTLPMMAYGENGQVLASEIALYIDGIMAKTTDVNGKKTHILNVDGTTYAPIRGLADALGRTVVWNDTNRTVSLATEGNNAQNDMAYLGEHFGITPFEQRISQQAYNSALEKIGATHMTEVKQLSAATVAQSLVSAANMTELALTYSETEALKKCQRYGINTKQEAIYLACALDMGLMPKTLDFKAPLTGDVAATILMNAVEATGKGRRFLGFSSDPDIAAHLITTWNSFIIFDDATLTKLGVDIVKSGATTGYNLKYMGNDANFLSPHTIQYGHSDITHAIQLMGLLNRSGLVARIQLEPKVSVYQYLLEWNDGKVPDTTPTYKVVKVDNEMYLCYAVEYDLKLEFSCKEDRLAFDDLILDYAKKSDANPNGEGAIYGAWWQPLYSTKHQMTAPNYLKINDVTVKNGAYTLHSFATDEQAKKVEKEINKYAETLSAKSDDLWVNAAFYRYLTGESHQ